MQFEARVEPRTIRAKQEFASASPLEGLDDVVELPNTRGVRVDVGISSQLIRDLLVGFPIIRITSKMGDDEIDPRVLRSKHVDHRGPADHVHKHWQAKRSGGFTDLPRRHGFITVDFDSTKMPLSNRLPDHLKNPPGIPLAMHKAESDEARGMARYKLRHLAVGPPVIAVQRRKNDGFVDSRCPGPSQIGVQRRVGIPWRCHLVSFAGVAMTIDDHAGTSHSGAGSTIAFPGSSALAMAARYHIQVSIPRKKLGR